MPLLVHLELSLYRRHMGEHKSFVTAYVMQAGGWEGGQDGAWCSDRSVRGMSTTFNLYTH